MFHISFCKIAAHAKKETPTPLGGPRQLRVPITALRGFDRAAERPSHLQYRMPSPASGKGHRLSDFRELETMKPLYQTGSVCQSDLRAQKNAPLGRSV